MSIPSAIRRPLGIARRTLRAIPNEMRRRQSLHLLNGAKRLHLGCGPHLLEGWVNVNPGQPGAAEWDLRYPLPVPDGTIDFIYSQHFIEHLTRDEGIRHLRDCYRVLRIGGVLRMSTPNLRYIAETYLAGNVKEWLTEPHFWNPQTPAQMINDALRLWGHQFVYDHPEMELVLREAGFATIAPAACKQSRHPELRNLEIRPDHNDLIVEATR